MLGGLSFVFGTMNYAFKIVRIADGRGETPESGHVIM